MQLDKLIDNYFNFDINSDPNPLTSSNINSHYHDIDSIGLVAAHYLVIYVFVV